MVCDRQGWMVLSSLILLYQFVFLSLVKVVGGLSERRSRLSIKSTLSQDKFLMPTSLFESMSGGSL